jgi:1,4-dihydroxy-2-naphthoate octaprenyltransferase
VKEKDNKFIYWIKAARLRTLPLALSCILLSSSLVLITKKNISFKVLLLTLTTTLLLQILSNFANDYGDAIKGADINKKGEQRMVQSGKISKNRMKTAILILSIITFLIGLLLIFVVFHNNYIKIFVFLILGILSITAAIKYTVGNNAYGYRALGDISVFIFFGVIGVMGSYYLFTESFHWLTIPGALFTGLLSCGVLNLNNLRDNENDQLNKKNTLVGKLGTEKAKKYHILLLIISILSFIIIVINSDNIYYNASLIPIFFILRHLYLFTKDKPIEWMDSQLKTLALSCFSCCFISFIIGNII